RRRAPAIPVSPAVGPRARNAQSPAARSARGCTAPGSPERRPASWVGLLNPGVRVRGRDRACRAQRHTRRERGLHPAQWDARGGDAAQIHVTTYGDSITLRFRSKGAKIVTKEFTAPRLVRAIGLLRPLPGRRLFQYRAEDGTVRGVTAREVNAFLREIAGANISLKDFRTLLASASVLAML